MGIFLLIWSVCAVIRFVITLAEVFGQSHVPKACTKTHHLSLYQTASEATSSSISDPLKSLFFTLNPPSRVPGDARHFNSFHRHKGLQHKSLIKVTPATVMQPRDFSNVSLYHRFVPIKRVQETISNLHRTVFKKNGLMKPCFPCTEARKYVK